VNISKIHIENFKIFKNFDLTLNKGVNIDCTKCKNPVYYAEDKEFEKHYFSNQLKIYSDKLSKFVFRCNEKTKGNVIDRISRIYPYIFIDEVQDLAGYDLELLKLLFTRAKYSVGIVVDNNEQSIIDEITYFIN